LEGEAFLNGMDWREVVIFELAKLKEAIKKGITVLAFEFRSKHSSTSDKGESQAKAGSAGKLGHSLFTGLGRLVN
jgi:hypothetical protein